MSEEYNEVEEQQEDLMEEEFEQETQQKKGFFANVIQFAPMFLASLALHMLVLLVIALIPATNTHKEQVVTVITDIYEKEEEEEIKEIEELEPDLTEVDVEIEMEEEVEEDEEVEVEEVEEEPAEDELMDLMVEDIQTDMSEVAMLGFDVGPSASNMPAGGILGGRSSSGYRRKSAGRATIQAIDHALRWLAAQQTSKGTWPNKAHINAISSSAALAFLGNGNSTRAGKYKHVVNKYVDHYIKAQQKDGSVGMHGLATPFVIMAMCDAYAMDPTHDGLKKFATKATEYVVNTQNNDGGWTGSGSTKAKDVKEIDVAQSAWYVMALFSADLAGIKIPSTCLKKVNKVFLEIAAGKYKGNIMCSSHGGLDVSYKKEYAIQSYISTVLQFSGSHTKVSAITKSSILINKGMPAEGKRNFWLLYNQGLGMFQLGPTHPQWKVFKEQVLKGIPKGAKRDGNGIFWDNGAIMAGQKKGGKDSGFGTKSYWGNCGSTAMAILNMQVFFRYGNIHGAGS
ncbi:MAG: terpene cyclase/mutase family protein [Planctomycetes bacterium]|nr:terpene cyclase/mutase family protein [Planctomycetota bacterium]